MWLPDPVAKPEPKVAAKVTEPEPPAANAPKQRRIGTLKSFSPAQGYGFIAADDIRDRHSCDVYIDRSQLPSGGETRQGQILEFEVVYNRRGQPQAKDVNWDPVTLLKREGRLVDVGSARSLNKILAPLRIGDKTQAVREAIELQENADTIDFVSFVLGHLGEPDRSIMQDLLGDVPVRLLMKIADMLEQDDFIPERLQTAVEWCEVLLPILSPQVIGASADTKFENLVGIVQTKIEAAAKTSGNPDVFQNLLSQVHMTAKS
jgi:cold shock CspA family protein